MSADPPEPKEPETANSNGGDSDNTQNEIGDRAESGHISGGEYSVKIKENKKYSPKHHRDRQDNISFGLRIITALVALAALIAATCAALYTQSAADAAWQQAKVANKQITENRKSAMIAQRAYVYAAPSEVFHVKGGSKLEGFVEIGNSGQTFGRNVRRWVGMAILPSKLPKPMGNLGLMEREDGVLSINPRVSHLVRRRRPALKTEQIKELHKSDGPLRIYVFGIIRYEDIFGHPHETKFCHMHFGGNFIEIKKTKTVGYWRRYAKYCDDYNSAD